MADGRVEYEIRADNSKLDQDFDDAGKKVEAGGNKLAGLASGAGKAIGAGMLAAGSAAVAIGVASVNSATNMEQAMNSYLASTGKGIEETERYKGVLEDIYVNGYGESFEDIANQMALVTQQMGELDDAQLQRVTESAYLLDDVFQMDIAESLRGAQSLMDQFGVSGEEAYNLMAQGAQKGLNQNQDLADQLAEYSTYYSDLGFSAEEMFNAMVNGAESGVYQIDYLNDAMKEFGIRAKDGSTTSKEAFAALGLDAEKMTADFAAGGDASREAFDTVVNALKSTDDAVLRNQVGVDLFGTKWEDLGENAVLALTDVQGSISSTNDALSEIEDIKYSDLGSMFEGLKRSAEMLLIPLGEKLIPVLTDIIQAVLPSLESALPPLMDAIESLIPPIMSVVEELLPPLVDLFETLLPPLMELIETLLPPLVELFSSLLVPLTDLIGAILPPLIDVLNILLVPIMDLVNTLMPPLVELFGVLGPLIESLSPIIEMLAGLLAGSLGAAFDMIMPVLDNFMSYLSGIIKFITGVFKGDWKMAWEGIKDVFKAIVNHIPSILEGVINGAIGLINNLIGGVNKLTGSIGIPAIPNIPNVTLPRFRTGIDYIPEDELPALLHKGEAVLTAEDAAVYRSLGGIDGIETMLSATAPTRGGQAVSSNAGAYGDIASALDVIMQHIADGSATEQEINLAVNLTANLDGKAIYDNQEVIKQRVGKKIVSKN